MKKKRVVHTLSCPVCMSDRLDVISDRMKQCKSCGFIWNHGVSDRDNLLLIVEHQAKLEKSLRTPSTETTRKRAAS